MMAKVGVSAGLRERQRLMRGYRRRGELPRGRCPCGRMGYSKLADLYDIGTLYHQCKSCEKREHWARRRGEVWVQPVETEEERLRREKERARRSAWGKVAATKMIEGLARYRAEQKRAKELAEKAVSDKAVLSAVNLEQKPMEKTP